MTDLLSVLEWCVEHLAMIPSAFWAVATPLGGVLGAVLLTNHANLRRLREEFANNRKLAVDEREHSLRKDVYLAATEAIVATVASVGRFADLNTPIRDLTNVMTERIPTVAKVHMVGKEDVVKKVIEIVSELTGIFQRLTAGRVPLDIMKQKIGLQDQEMSRSSKEIDILVEQMKSYNLCGEVDPRRWSAISANLEFERNVIRRPDNGEQRLNGHCLSVS